MIGQASTERPAAGDSPVGRGGQRPGKGDSEMIESGCQRQDLEVPQRYIRWPLALSDGTDTELLAGVAAGRLGAFEALYDRYRVIAYSVALRIATDPTAAEDVVQEAFTSAWRNAARYDHARGSVKTWLLAIVHHRAVDAVRRRRPTTHLPELEETTAMAFRLPDVWPEVAARLDDLDQGGAKLRIGDVAGRVEIRACPHQRGARASIHRSMQARAPPGGDA